MSVAARHLHEPFRCTHQPPKILNDKRPFIWLHDAYRLLRESGCAIVFCRWDTEDVLKTAMETAGFTINGPGGRPL